MFSCSGVCEIKAYPKKAMMFPPSPKCKVEMYFGIECTWACKIKASSCKHGPRLSQHCKWGEGVRKNTVANRITESAFISQTPVPPRRASKYMFGVRWHPAEITGKAQGPVKSSLDGAGACTKFCLEHGQELSKPYCRQHPRRMFWKASGPVKGTWAAPGPARSFV